MNLYKFYRVQDVVSDKVDTSTKTIDTPEEFLELSMKFPLVAFTNDKHIRRLYRLIRGDDRIREVVNKDIDKEEYKEFKNQHYGECLDMRPVLSLTTEKGSVESYVHNVPLTFEENELLDSLVTDIYLEDILAYRSSPDILEDKYLDMLNKILYLNMYYRSKGDIYEAKESKVLQRYLPYINDLNKSLIADELIMLIKYMMPPF